MIQAEAIAAYSGEVLERGERHLHLLPDARLRPYLSNYTLTFPTLQLMPEAYTILPSASATLTVSVDGGRVVSGLRGVNTKAVCVGGFASRQQVMLLVEFRPGGLYPFFAMDQWELTDISLGGEDWDCGLLGGLERALTEAREIGPLMRAVNAAFLSRLRSAPLQHMVLDLLQGIRADRGQRSAREYAGRFHYSERQLRRLFLQYVGVSPKKFNQIVRVNQAVRRLQAPDACGARTALETGYFDQAHLIRDFRLICGMTPTEYRRNMSVYYNEEYKL